MREAELKAILRRSASLMQVLTTVRGLALPDWIVFSGAVYQTALNGLGGYPPDHGIKDYDVGYFDASDLSYVAEDRVIRSVAAAFDPPFRDKVEVRNQARVHLWFENRFGEPYAPLHSTAEALERFVSPLSAVGVRLEADGRLSIFAPFGLSDLSARRFECNPNRASPHFDRIAASVKGRWPEVVVAR